MEVQAFAKLNLTLDVLSRRPDGYHDLRMIMQSVTLADSLTLTVEGETAETGHTIYDGALKFYEDNTAV